MLCPEDGCDGVTTTVKVAKKGVVGGSKVCIDCGKAALTVIKKK